MSCLFAIVALALVVVVSSATLVQAASKPSVLWKTEFGFESVCPPLLSNDDKQMYVASGTKFGLLDTSTGKVITSASEPDAYLATNIIKVGDSKVAYNNRFSLICRDATSLKLEWNFTAGGVHYFDGAPVYIPSESAVYGVTSIQATLYKIDADSGGTVWKAFLGGNVTINDELLPTMTFSKANNLLIVPAAKTLRAVQPGSGEVVWSVTTKDHIATTPVLSNDESTVYISTGTGVVYAISTATGTVNRYYATGGFIINTPSLVDNVLYFGGFGPQGCFALHVRDVFYYKWKVDCPGDVTFGTSRVFEDTVIFGASPVPFALHRKDGSVAWNASNVDPAQYLGIAAPTSDGRLFTTSNFGKITALQLPRSTPAPLSPIYEKECLRNSDCSGKCTVVGYQPDTCVKTGPNTSIMRQCADTWTEVVVTEFTNSSSCETRSPAKQFQFAVDKCYTHLTGGSFRITGCTPGPYDP